MKIILQHSSLRKKRLKLKHVKHVIKIEFIETLKRTDTSQVPPTEIKGETERKKKEMCKRKQLQADLQQSGVMILSEPSRVHE